jgi:hypothetical protein
MGGGAKKSSGIKVRRCKLTGIESRVASAWFQRSKLQFDGLHELFG